VNIDVHNDDGRRLVEGEEMTKMIIEVNFYIFVVAVDFVVDVFVGMNW